MSAHNSRSRPPSAGPEPSNSLPDTQPFDSQMLRAMTTNSSATQVYPRLDGSRPASDVTPKINSENGANTHPDREPVPPPPVDIEQSSTGMLFSTSPAGGAKPLTDSMLYDIGYTPAASRTGLKTIPSFAFPDTPLARRPAKLNARTRAMAAALSSSGLHSSPAGSNRNGLPSEGDITGAEMAELFGAGRHARGRDGNNAGGPGSDGLEMTLSQIFQTTQSQVPGAGGYNIDDDDSGSESFVPPPNPGVAGAQSRSYTTSPLKGPAVVDPYKSFQNRSNDVGSPTHGADQPLSPSQSQFTFLPHPTATSHNSRLKSIDHPFSSSEFRAPVTAPAQPVSRMAVVADVFSSPVDGTTQVLSQGALDRPLDDVPVSYRVRVDGLQTHNARFERAESDLSDLGLLPDTSTTKTPCRPDFIDLVTPAPVPKTIARRLDPLFSDTTEVSTPTALPRKGSPMGAKQLSGAIPGAGVVRPATATAAVVHVPMTSSNGADLSPDRVGASIARAGAAPPETGDSEKKFFSRASSSITDPLTTPPSPADGDDSTIVGKRQSGYTGNPFHSPSMARQVLGTPVATRTETRDASSVASLVVENTPISTLRSTGIRLDDATFAPLGTHDTDSYFRQSSAARLLQVQNDIPQSSLPSAKQLLLTQVVDTASQISSNRTGADSSSGPGRDTNNRKSDRSTVENEDESLADGDQSTHPDAIPSSPPVLAGNTRPTSPPLVETDSTEPSTPKNWVDPRKKTKSKRNTGLLLAEIASRPSPEKLIDMSVVDEIVLVSKEDAEVSQFLSSLSKPVTRRPVPRSGKGVREKSPIADDRNRSTEVSSISLESLERLNSERVTSSASDIPAWMDSTLLSHGQRKSLKTFTHRKDPVNPDRLSSHRVPSPLHAVASEKPEAGKATESSITKPVTGELSWRKPRSLKILTTALDSPVPSPSTADPHVFRAELTPAPVPISASSDGRSSGSALSGRKRPALEREDVDSAPEEGVRDRKRRRSRRAMDEEDQIEYTPNKPSRGLSKRGMHLRVVESSTPTASLAESERTPATPAMPELELDSKSGIRPPCDLIDCPFDLDDPVQFPGRMRVFARFQGLTSGFYPATWIGRMPAPGSGADTPVSGCGINSAFTFAAPSPSTSSLSPVLRVRFDDGTEADVDAQFVRPLYLRPGDHVKVDKEGLRKLIYVVVRGSTGEEAGAASMLVADDLTDVRGLKYLVLEPKKVEGKPAPKPKGNRRGGSRKGDSVSKAGATNDSDDSGAVTVPVTSVYLTPSMWTKFVVRTGSIPWNTMPPDGHSRNQMPTSAVKLGLPPTSSRLSTTLGSCPPSVAYSPFSGKLGSSAIGPIHTALSLPKLSPAVSSARSPKPRAVFGNMAIAVTHPDEQEKDRIQRLLADHGCVIIERGFDELFDHDGASTLAVPGAGRAGPRSGTSGKGRSRLRAGLASIPEVTPTTAAKLETASVISDLTVTSPEDGHLSAALDLSSHLSSTAQSIGFVALISDAPCRRIKYMQALALGVPCLSAAWVKLSIAAGKPLPPSNFLLPAGVSAWAGGMRSLVLPRSEIPGSDLDDPVNCRFEVLMRYRHRPLAQCNVVMVQHSSSADLTKHRAVLEARVRELTRLSSGQDQSRALSERRSARRSRRARPSGGGDAALLGTDSSSSEQLSSPPPEDQPRSNTDSNVVVDDDDDDDDDDDEATDDEVHDDSLSDDDTQPAPTNGPTRFGGAAQSFASGISGASGPPSGRAFTNTAFLTSFIFLARAMGAVRVETCKDLDTAAKMVISGWRHPRTGVGVSAGAASVSAPPPWWHNWDCLVVQASDLAEQMDWIKLVKQVAALEHDRDDDRLVDRRHRQVAMLHDQVIVQSLLFGPRPRLDREEGDVPMTPALGLMAEAAFYSGVKFTL